MSSTAGEFITETLEYDGGRQVTAYVPAAAAEAVVFAGDGQLITSWGEVLKAADLPPTMIIGAHRVEDETLRLHEYSSGRSTAAFAFATVRGPREVLRRGRPAMGGDPPGCQAASRPNRGVRCLGRCGTRAGHGAAPSRHLRRGLLRLARGRVPAARRAARPASVAASRVGIAYRSSPIGGRHPADGLRIGGRR